MNTTAPTPRLAPALGRALAHGDARALAALYADDAVLEIVSPRSPPAHPAVFRGRSAIEARLVDERARDPLGGFLRPVHASRLVEVAETDDVIGFFEERVYTAGDRVLACHLAKKRLGKIAHDRAVVAWDDAL